MMCRLCNGNGYCLKQDPIDPVAYTQIPCTRCLGDGRDPQERIRLLKIAVQIARPIFQDIEDGIDVRTWVGKKALQTIEEAMAR